MGEDQTLSRWERHPFTVLRRHRCWELYTTVPRPMRNMVRSTSNHLDWVAEAMVAGHGFGNEYYGFTYDTDIDEEDDEEPFVGVQVNDYEEEVVLSHADFDDLMLRVFDAWIVSTDRHHLDREPWWPAFIRDVETIRARVAART